MLIYWETEIKNSKDRCYSLDYNLICNYIAFDLDEIMEMLEEYCLEKYVLLDHYFEDQLVESSVVFVEDFELECDPGDASGFLKQKYLKENSEDHDFAFFLRNNFATAIFINGSMLEIEIQNGRIVLLVGSRGELILRTGLESYVLSSLFKLNIQPGSAPLLLDSLFAVLTKNYADKAREKVSNDTFTMVSGVCLMGIAKLNELPVNNYELNLSHDEMLLFGLALNLAGEIGDKETQRITRLIMEQIKSYFPEIEHISPESFEVPRMGQLISFKKPNDEGKDKHE